MRYRHDGFTPERQRKFFKTLAKTGCVADACRVARISSTTVSRWRKKEPWFAAELRRCRKVAAGEIERLAWDRAVNGTEEKVVRDGKVVQIKIKPSDSILRLLLQGSNPKKYGRPGRGGATRKQIEKKLRKEIEAEMWEKLRPRSLDEVHASILRKLEAIRRHRIEHQGWREGPDGGLLPPDGAEGKDRDGDEDGA